MASDAGALTEAVYYILLSLHEPMHGYAIMQNISKLTENRLNIGAGTLYGAINTLLDKNWITAMDNPSDSRKKEYIVTPQARLVVEQEISRLRELLENGAKITGGNFGG